MLPGNTVFLAGGKSYGKGSVTLTAGATWTVDPTFDPTKNTVECYAAGGGGAGGYQYCGLGGAGGGYSKISNLPLTPGSIVDMAIGLGGAGGGRAAAGTAGGDTWFVSAATALAKGGGAGQYGNASKPGAAGGAAADGVGDVKYSGGAGGGTNFATPRSGGSGGGGGAGPNSDGTHGTDQNGSGNLGLPGGPGGGGLAGAGGRGGDGLTYGSTIPVVGGNYGGGGGGGGLGGTINAQTTGAKGGDGVIKITWGQ
jgi:hypothetical protein